MNSKNDLNLNGGLGTSLGVHQHSNSSNSNSHHHHGHHHRRQRGRKREDARNIINLAEITRRTGTIRRGEGIAHLAADRAAAA